MKRTIRGTDYDTEKSVLIGSHQHGKPGDPSHWEAGLYVTPISGKYFLAGSGGGMTLWEGGEGIRRLDRSEAFQWAKAYLSKDDVAEFFGD